jgi:hypothetical protein
MATKYFGNLSFKKCEFEKNAKLLEKNSQTFEITSLGK